MADDRETNPSSVECVAKGLDVLDGEGRRGLEQESRLELPSKLSARLCGGAQLTS